jgi:hypothetical protein
LPKSNHVVDLDVSWLAPADLCAVDALARLQVAVTRCGCRLLLHGADGGLVELLEFVGLADVMHLCACCAGSCNAANHPRGGCPQRGADDLRRGVEGKAEQLEQPRVDE